jgi:hypothetical protein
MAFNFLQSPWQLFKAAARADTLEFLIIAMGYKILEKTTVKNSRTWLS